MPGLYAYKIGNLYRAAFGQRKHGVETSLCTDLSTKDVDSIDVSYGLTLCVPIVSCSDAADDDDSTSLMNGTRHR